MRRIIGDDLRHTRMDELLREAACLGNLDAVQKLLEKGASINSQHSINGWYETEMSRSTDPMKYMQDCPSLGLQAWSRDYS